MFLTYDDCVCHHEKLMHMRSMGDFKKLLSPINTGTAETASSYGRCLIKWLIPNIREVVILRPVEEVIQSLLSVDFQGSFVFDEVKLRKIIEKGNRALQRIAQDPKVLVINYDDLDKEETCAKIFEFCLPHKFDKEWWGYMKDRNIQVNLGLLFSYRYQNKKDIDGFKSLCKRELLRLCRLGEIPLNGAL